MQITKQELLLREWEQIDAAFDNHDAKGMGAFWDQSIESWDGSLKGAAEVEYYADLFKRQPSIKSKRFEEIGIVFVTPDVAVYKARMDNTGLVDEDGKLLPQVKWLGAWVMVKKNGKWLSAAFFSRHIEE
ncbi:MAG: nuclear transport factor 2 family protein [Nitrososphaerales archaeon]